MNIIPILRRKVIEPLWTLKSRSPMLSSWNKLERTQYFSEEKLRERQWIKLKQLIEFVYLNNKYYRDKFDATGIHPRDIKSIKDIIKLPILTKKDIKENGNLIISVGYNKSKLIEAKTGGSTGKPLKIYYTEECSVLQNACARRHDRWSGWEVGEPVGCVWGNPEYPVGLKAKLRATLLAPIIYLDTMSINEESVINFSKQWRRVKPTLLFGHAHSIYILAVFVIKMGIQDVTPKSIITSSMMLLSHERTIVEKAFGVKVFDRYGCEEVGLIASECEKHEGMHINIDNQFVEFIKKDGSYAKHGEQGYIVITNFENRAMPFIRYKIEDMGIPFDMKCSCGRGLPLMDKVAGRTADFLVKSDGTKVAGVSLIERSLTAIEGIEQMQIVQNKKDSINIYIVKGNQYNDKSERLLLDEFKRVFGEDINISVKYIEQILQERSGKYRFSICKV